MDGYKKRIADNILKDKLEYIGGVLIEGPKWCGKTTTAEQTAGSVLYMADPQDLAANLQMAEISPGMLLDGKSPRLIDEWQIAPQLWDAARFEIDHRRSPGQFIFTGSAVPADRSKIRHSGTGRFSWLTMRPMSLWESGESNGEVSVRSLFEQGGQIVAHNDLVLGDIARLLCRGGWPQATNLDGDHALKISAAYYEAVVKTDISQADGVKRDETRTRRLMRSYARNQGAQATIRSIRDDISANEPNKMDEETVTSYINALKRIFVIEDSTAWSPNLRSKTAIRTSDTRYFIDPSIATCALGVGPKDLMSDLNTMGLLFETMAVRDLRVYADASEGGIFHYRDKSGLECDAVMHRRNGQYGLIEIKLGGEALIEAGANTLNALAEEIDTTKMQAPTFLMVLTAVGKYAYQRKDGVYVVPIGCLKD
jgi:predicted AAA+ superfamily ATPase